MLALLVFLPLLSAIYAGLFGRFMSHQRAHFITTSILFVSAILSGCVFYEVAVLGNNIIQPLLRWIDVGDFTMTWSLRVDSLTAVMLVVVTWVSALVHLYSRGYMSHDPHVPRFMAYLSLFTFCMLMLVTSDNFLQLFFGWEGVGLCSYLLIGFWYKKQSACAAAMKAFIVNRIGDFGFILGIFAIYQVFGTIDFGAVFAAVPTKVNAMISIAGFQFDAITVICLLLFIGAMGKSAQLGLHTWLPDAMEGPTPVSALIHAATMVTAGVFMVARCSPIFEYSITALNVVTLVGAATAIFAATVAITQNDIKRVVAYSTCSQLGYMFFACGVSAYSAGVFHLMTHGFFKALLFLGAGSVIHAFSDEQDLRKMGGVWKKIPQTYTMMWIGSLALAGVFPFAGFYSKDLILEAAYLAKGFGGLAFYLGLSAAFLTAFYSWRLLIMAFHGAPRSSEKVMKHVHEPSVSMRWPLYLLSIGAIVSGAIGYYVFHMVDEAGTFWRGAIKVLDTNNVLGDIHHIPLLVKLSPSLVGAAGIFLAYVFYMWMPSLPEKIAKSAGFLYRFLLNKWYFDEIYDAIFVRPIKLLGSFLWKFTDVKIIDGLGPNGMAFLSMVGAKRVSKIQNGYIFNYVFVMVLGVILLLCWYLISRYHGYY